jgi:glutamate 5-kinase
VATLAQDIAAMKARGQEVLIISSGAIALGRNRLELGTGALRLEESQAAAATGQLDLAHAYREALQPHGLTISQVLLPLEDTEERRRYLNARNTIDTLLSLGAVPVVNENDTVATSEIRFGDNDRLAARVASMIGADCMILLSDIDGLYTADPSLFKNAEFVTEVKVITEDIEAMAGPNPEKTASSVGSGGMVTKLLAAKIAMGAGCHMAIANGKINHPLKNIEESGHCTWFVANASPRAARKQWIAGTLAAQGTFDIDAGAVKALEAGKSLLPTGIKSVSGVFERGDAVIVQSPAGQEIARGLSAYSSEDASKIIGRNSSEIEQRLGYHGRAEMIHRDDLVLTNSLSAP